MEEQTIDRYNARMNLKFIILRERNQTQSLLTYDSLIGHLGKGKTRGTEKTLAIAGAEVGVYKQP